MAIFGEAEDSEETVEVVAKSCTDLAIDDLSLKTSDGLDATHEINIKLSTHNESVYVEEASPSHACAYVPSQAGPPRGTVAVCKMLDGNTYYQKVAIAEAFNRLVFSRLNRHSCTETACFSGGEWQVFELLGPGSIQAQIAEIVDIEVSAVNIFTAVELEKRLV